tara:strand:+ start:1998 stop:2744 length:747 start_codon:yes stop_codon:yes gene_type:complete
MMAIRGELYEWELTGKELTLTDIPPAGMEFSVFTSGYGNELGQTALVSEDSFIVINRVACTPGVSPNGYEVVGGILTKWIPNMFVQIVIDTTGYYCDPQNLYQAGISGMASPYPMTVNRIKYYDLFPPIYVLPDQTWDIRFTLYNDLLKAYENGLFTNVDDNIVLAQVFIDYTLYDGTDAILARKLLSLGVPVTIDTVQWLRQLILQNKGLDTETFDFYLKAVREIAKKAKEQRKLQGLATISDYDPS